MGFSHSAEQLLHLGALRLDQTAGLVEARGQVRVLRHPCGVPTVVRRCQASGRTVGRAVPARDGPAAVLSLFVAAGRVTPMASDDGREVTADERDRLADDRERQQDQRDGAQDRREARQDERDVRNEEAYATFLTHVSRTAGASRRAIEHSRDAIREGRALLKRSSERVDRWERREDRSQASAAREQAELDREIGRNDH